MAKKTSTLSALALTALLLALIPAGGSAASKYRGFLGDHDGRSERTAKAGDYHALDFRVADGGRVEYRVCITGGSANKRKCFNRTTNRRGRSNVNVSLYFSDPDLGGPGSWKARWSVSGRTVAKWSFKATSQGFAEGS